MINVGIVGYGNLGRGALLAISKNSDFNLVGVFSRRNPDSVKVENNAKVYHVDELKNFKGKIDVLLLCGGSATDLPSTTSEYLKDFNTVDSFDTHALIPEYYKKLDKVAKNPFIQEDLSYNPCQNCISQTYVWIEEDIKNNFSTNPFVKKKIN